MNAKNTAIALVASIAFIALLGCVQQPAACTEEAKVCPDGTAVGRNSALNCEFDPCPSPRCKGEGETIPVIANPPSCCPGLELIPPKEENWLGISGYCTAKCGNGTCDEEAESNYNCPADCTAQAEGEQVVGPEYYGSEQEAFDALGEEIDGLEEPSAEELEAMLGD